MNNAANEFAAAALERTKTNQDTATERSIDLAAIIRIIGELLDRCQKDPTDLHTAAQKVGWRRRAIVRGIARRHVHPRAARQTADAIIAEAQSRTEAEFEEVYADLPDSEE